MAAGRAGAAVRKAKQEERLLEQLRAAKELFRPLRATAHLPIFLQRERKRFPRKKQPERREGLINWTPRVVRACLAGGALVFLRNAQTRSPASVAQAPLTPWPVDKPPSGR